MNDQKQGIQSLEIGVGVFLKVQELGGSVDLADLSNATGLSPSKLHRYCVSLVRVGLLQQEQRGRYSLGPQSYRISGADSELEALIKRAKPALAAFVREVSETTFIAVWRSGGPSVIHIEEADRPVSVRPGGSPFIPVTRSASGRVFGAFLDEARVKTVVDDELSTLTAKKRKERLDAFHAEVAGVKRTGLARSIGDLHRGITSFSAPVFGTSGEIVMALTVFGISDGFSADLDGRVPIKLAELARRLSA